MCFYSYFFSSVESHFSVFQAIHGQAIDRHLLGLKIQGIEDLTSMPEIFMDTSFAVAHHYNLSTSQVHLHLTKPTVCCFRANYNLSSYLFTCVFALISMVSVSRLALRQTV